MPSPFPSKGHRLLLQCSLHQFLKPENGLHRGGISHNNWIENKLEPKTTSTDFGKSLSPTLTKILAWCNSDNNVTSSSTKINCPQLSPIRLRIFQLHMKRVVHHPYPSVLYFIPFCATTCFLIPFLQESILLKTPFATN